MTTTIRNLLLGVLLAGCGADRSSKIADLIEPARPPILHAGAFNVCWDRIEAPPQLSAGARFELVVTVRNCSNAIWPDPQMGDVDQLNGSHAVRLVHRWRVPRGPLEERWSARSDLPWPLLPGKSVELPVLVTAPARPGHHAIEFDLLQENVVWFGEQTGIRPTVAVEVR